MNTENWCHILGWVSLFFKNKVSVKGKADTTKKVMDGQSSWAECCLSQCGEEYEQATPSLLWVTNNQKEWQMSSFISVDQSLQSIATAKKKKDFHLVPATTNFVSLLFLKWSTDHWENLQFNSHHQSHHNIWPLLALFEFSSKINYMYVTLPILQFLPLVISAVFMAQSLGKY